MQSIKAPPADGTFVPAQAAALSQAPAARPVMQPAMTPGQVRVAHTSQNHAVRAIASVCWLVCVPESVP